MYYQSNLLDEYGFCSKSLSKSCLIFYKYCTIFGSPDYHHYLLFPKEERFRRSCWHYHRKNHRHRSCPVQRLSGMRSIVRRKQSVGVALSVYRVKGKGETVCHKTMINAIQYHGMDDELLISKVGRPNSYQMPVSQASPDPRLP